MEAEVLPSAIEAICARFKKATDRYCEEYPRQFAPHSRFESATRAYDRCKRQFNNAVQDWLSVHGELPEWAKDALVYQTNRGFLDPLWKTWRRNE